ncbi:TOM1 [Candida pseudojiufengensis]|uniref:TOM1 n=1 Tax=Candida pseudojiufengensis TaxID=497109 RepID=UPI002225143F|nr:TOM1 [Candida pseudojiufengensis]KAI5958943.1 TOM1 [Candida pseudojiufengensis]
MIIEKREHRQRMEMSPPVKDLIDKLINSNDEEFSKLLSANIKWNRVRGDLLHWIPILNKIDDIFAKYIKEYDLENEYPKLQIIPKEDTSKLVTCLEFTNTLLNNCSDKQIYSSSERIYALINTPTIDIRLKALEVAVIISEKFVTSGSSRFSAPKNVRNKILEIAKSFPPLVPTDCTSRQYNETIQDGRSSVIGDHFNFTDLLKPNKIIPERWKSINFQYYKSVPQQNSKSNDSTISEGLQVFTIPEESVAKKSLDQLFTKGMEILPKNSWFAYSLAVEVSKSFQSNSESIKLREKLIQIKCFATGFSCCMLSNQNTSSKLLEAEPYILSFLVDTISPDNEWFVPNAVFFSAMKALECISMKKIWGSDILRCMNGNVSHGVLYQCLRRILVKITTEDPNYNEEAYILFFNMLGNMITTKSLLPRLTSGGLLNDLIPFLKIRSKYKWTCSAAIHSLSLYLSAEPESLDEFISNNGFTLLIDAINDEVMFTLANVELSQPNYGEIAPYSKMPLRRMNYLKNLMKVVADLLNSDRGDRLRNLFDSPLLLNFNQIILNPKIFGPQVLAYTIDSVFYIIHNEPTAFSILNEAGVVDAVLNNYKDLFLPFGPLLISLPEVIGAICLNNQGLDKVIEKQIIKIFFETFFDLSLAKILVKSDMATNLGCSFDELGRHYPRLKPFILSNIEELLKKLQTYIKDNMKGVKFYEGRDQFYYGKNNDILSKDGEEIESWENQDCSFVVDNVYLFLGGLLQDSGQWGSDVVELIDFDIWLGFLTLDVPYDYFLSNGITSLMGILKYFDDENRDYGFPKVMNQLRDTFRNRILLNYVRCQSDESFFNQITISEANELLKVLNKVNVLLFTLTEIYMNLGLLFNDRIIQILEQFNYDDFTKALYQLLERSIIEETIIRNNTPDKVLKLTSNFPNDSPPLQLHIEGFEDTKPDTSFTNPQFKNNLQLRTFNYFFQGYIALIFATAVRACVPKRTDFMNSLSKKFAVSFLLELAEFMEMSYDRKLENKYNYHCYVMAISNVNLYILSQKERNKDNVFTPLAMALFQKSFYKKLIDVTVDLVKDLVEFDPKQVQETAELKYINSSPVSILKNAISQNMMIFARSVNAEDFSNFPFVKGYFSNGYGVNIEAEVISATLLQIRDVILQLVVELTNLITKSKAEGLEVKNIPTPIIEQLIFIASNIYSSKREIPSEFVPLDEEYLFPPEEQVAFLISLGMSESQAEHYFEHENDLSNLIKGKALSCPEFNEYTKDDWNSWAQIAKEEEFDFNFSFPEFKKRKEILLQRDQSWSDQTWLLIAYTYPKTTHLIADLFLTLHKGEIIGGLIDAVSSQTDQLKPENYSVQVHLISLLLQDDEVRKQGALKDVGKVYEGDIISESYVDDSYFQYIMSIVEQKLIAEDVFVPKVSKHEDINYKFDTNESHVQELKNFLCGQISSIKHVDNLRSANGLARVLALLAKDFNLAREISKFPILANLIQISKTESTDKVALESLKTSVVLIIRYCFESKQVVETYMKPEIQNIFGNNFKQSKYLKTILKDNLSMLFRDSQVYASGLSEEILLEKYDGKMNITFGDLQVIKAKNDRNSTTDTEMSGEVINELKSGVIMNVLLSELMDVVKSDWVSDPKISEVEKKNKKEVDLFENSNFAYMCFLLQSITELVGSYKQAKFDFLTFSRKPQQDIKPRSTALNFFIHQLIPTHSLEKSGPEYDRRCAISSVAKMTIMTLISSPLSNVDDSTTTKKEDPDLALIRRFVADILIKIMKDTSRSNLLAEVRYGKLLDLFELSGLLISAKFRDAIGPILNKDATKFDIFHITKVYIEKHFPQLITNLIAEFDLNYPEIDKVIKTAIKPITLLGKNKIEYHELFKEENQDENEEDDIVPEDEHEDREETPDLFRNSTLGMYDVDIDSEEEEFYEDGPLEVLMSGDEIESDESSELSAIDSSGDDDDESILEEDVDMDRGSNDNEFGEGSGSDGSLGDIEIIDELDIDSSSDVDEFDDSDGRNIDLDDEDESENEEDDDESESDYDEDELDGWIEAFEDGHNGIEDGPRPRVHSISNGHDSRHSFLNGSRDFRLDTEVVDDDEEDASEGEFSDNESESNVELRMVTPHNHGLRRIFDQAGFSQLERTSPALSLLLDGLFREGNFRGSIEISNDEGVGRGSHRTISRLFENMMHLGQAAKHAEHTHNLHIKSTKERWIDAFKMFNPKNKDDMVLRVIPGIINQIEEKSAKVYNEKRAELENLRKERDEREKKRLEEEQKKREEEAKRREEAAANAPPRDPVMVRIGDRDVDISGTDIDPDYIEALPEDMREEVLASYVRERRANASSTETDAREIDPDFLNALPSSIREEILQQESLARRYAAFEENGNEFEDAMADPEENEDEDEEIEEYVDNIIQSSAPRSRRSSAAVTTNSTANDSTKSKKKSNSKIFFLPLVDKNGIAALIRLLFSPLSINQRESIYHALEYMCHNKQSRLEIMNIMIGALNDLFTNNKSLQKIYSQLCSRALGGKDVKSRVPSNSTPISVGIQLIESIDYLLERNIHLRYYLLSEHEITFSVNKKGKKSKDNKYPINNLLKLLENKLIVDDQSFLDILARVLQVSTRPLHSFKKNEENKQSTPFPLPTIPQEYLKLIVKILTGNDCSNSTFRRAISAMQNLATLPEASEIFTKELSTQASTFGKKIIVDLNKLSTALSEGEIEARLFSKFSAHSSDQAKLLRILTALDYMFEHRVEINKKQDNEIEELTELYKNLALGNLWDALSECLRILEKNSQYHNVANALLPLIEALMVVCKHGKVREIKDNSKFEIKRIDFTKEPIESLFFSFTDEHKKILNQMVRTNSNLMSGPFSMLVKNPKVLEFDNKKNYFDRKLHLDKKENSKLSINVRRDQVFLDSYRALFFKPKDEFKNSKLDINFKGEQGIDAGGVTREWYQVLSRQMFNPDYALFTPVVSDETTFHPNRTSYVNPEHLSFFKFIGRIIGKAIYDNCFLDCHFSRAVYKRILGEPQSLKDMETLDLDYYKSLNWMLENDITDIITETFSVETDDYGEHKIIDLIENGSNIPVTEENKQDYVRKVVEYKLQTSVEEQMENFLIGFHEIIPKDLISIFDEKELELLISGLPDIDVHDWQTNTGYNNYSPSSLQIQWFWRAVKSFDNEERARLLQFATGTSKVPLNGFKELSGASGTCKFSIHRDYGTTDRLPSSHTCFNQIDLPAYENYETLRGSLLMAITEGHEGFGLA